MSKIKLVDFDPGVPYETEFGTCDLCMSTGEAQDPRFKFKYEDGTTEWVDGSFWSWGDQFVVDIDNTAAFAGWLVEQDFKPDFRIKDYSDLDSIAQDYAAHIEDWEDDLYKEDYYL